MASGELTALLKAEAQRLGFALAGVCPAVRPQGITHLAAWLDAGFAGEMHYIANRREAYDHPRHVLDGAKSVVMLAMNYRTAEPAEPQAGEGRISRYAWGHDYHDLLRDRLNALCEFVRLHEPSAMVRGVVDTAPLLEREFSQLAGLGWIGKNTMLINKWIGSWFFLSGLVTDLELEYDTPNEADHCGTCRACLDACPTQAFVAPHKLDARRCISYLTIELRSPIPHELRTGVADWLFGCDVCQDVCPWNPRAPLSPEGNFSAGDRTNPIELVEFFSMTDDQFRQRFRHTPLWRSKRRGILRNAAIVLGNQFRGGEATAEIHEALIRGLNDPEPLVRGAAAWALGEIGDDKSVCDLAARLGVESDADVKTEIQTAIDKTNAPSE